MALKSEQKDSCTIIVLGEANVGKTSLINRFRNDQFQEQLLTTLGLDCTTKDIILKSGKKAVMKIYDTAGQERYRTITKSYYQKANGILLVYSVKDRDSFMRISDLIAEIKEIKDTQSFRLVSFLITISFVVSFFFIILVLQFVNIFFKVAHFLL